MTPSTLRRVGFGIAALVLAAWGLHAWRTDEAARLLAEIAGVRAARTRATTPPPSDEERGTAEMYEKAAASMDQGLFTTGFFTEFRDVPWTEHRPSVAALVDGHAEALSLLEAAAARTTCRFADDRLLGSTSVYRIPTLLAARGQIEVQRGDFAACARTVSLLRSIGEDLGGIPWSAPSVRFDILTFAAELRAAGLLSAIATSPVLRIQEAGEALAAAAGPWGTARETQRNVDSFEEHLDFQCTWALGPDAEAWLEAMQGGPQSLEMKVKEMFRGPRRGRLPTVGEVREVRAAAAEAVAAARRGDVAAFAPLGPVDRSYGRWPESGFSPEQLGALSPSWFRGRLRTEAILSVSRAAIAVRAFQLREGRPPASLRELVPGTISEVPLDPFDGKPLEYAADPGDGWTVGSRLWSGTFRHPDGTTETLPPVEVKFPRPAR